MRIFYKKIFICATEQSGDNIGSQIIKKLKTKNKRLKFYGVGGEKMLPYLKKQYFSVKDFKSIGLIEIILSIAKYLNFINILSNTVIKNKFDLIITIDSPDFNYPLAKKIKKNGYKGKIIQVVAPTVWAWREKRAEKFSKVFDEIFTLFNFENKYFEKYGLKSTCIGHPIYYIKNIYNKQITKKNIVFLPGSRTGEINSLFKYFEIAYKELLKIDSKYTIIIPTLPHLESDLIHKTKNWKIKTLILTNNQKINSLYKTTKYAIVCSGTASLEIAKMGIPQLVIYKLNFITELILTFFVKTKFANIVNIISKKELIPELVNSKLNEKSFLNFIKNYINEEKFDKRKLKIIDHQIKKIEMMRPPFEIAAKALTKYL